MMKRSWNIIFDETGEKSQSKFEVAEWFIQIEFSGNSHKQPKVVRKQICKK